MHAVVEAKEEACQGGRHTHGAIRIAARTALAIGGPESESYITTGLPTPTFVSRLRMVTQEEQATAQIPGLT